MSILHEHEKRIARLEQELRETRSSLDRAMQQLSLVEGNTMGAVEIPADTGGQVNVSENDRVVCLTAENFWGVDQNGAPRMGRIELTWQDGKWIGGGDALIIYLQNTTVHETTGGADSGHLDEVMRFRSGILSLRDDVNVASQSEGAPMRFGFVTLSGVQYALPLGLLAD